MLTGKAVELIMRLALFRKTFDNVTGIMISLKNILSSLQRTNVELKGNY